VGGKLENIRNKPANKVTEEEWEILLEEQQKKEEAGEKTEAKNNKK